MRIGVTSLILASIVVVSTFSSAVADQRVGSDVPCDVTSPNGIVAGEPGVVSGQAGWQAGSFGNALLSAGPFGLSPDGAVIFKPGGAGFVLTPTGELGMKFGWTKVAGTLVVTGRRLDADAAPLRFFTKYQVRGAGFQPGYMIFSTPGCWEVTAWLTERDDSKLTFVTRVVKIGDGPVRLRQP